MPNVLCDFHEMGTNSPTFQPGEPTRTNPLTPELNQKLTMKIASYHAKALDKIVVLILLKRTTMILLRKRVVLPRHQRLGRNFI
jgi:hypothetical protein